MEKKITKIETWIANDGTEFQNEESCRTYEKQNQPDIVETEVYLHADKWEIYEELQDKFIFSEYADLKYLLSEVKVGIKINTQTGDYEIISVDGMKVIPNS